MSNTSESPFYLICRLENLGYHYRFSSGSINIWPLVRQCIWICLISSPSPENELRHPSSVINFLFGFFRRVFVYLFKYKRRASLNGTESVAFFSRPVYLQNAPSNQLIDRVVDPLLCCIPNGINSVKYYVSSWPAGRSLAYKASVLMCPQDLGHSSLSPDQLEALLEISKIIKISSSILIKKCTSNLQKFNLWYNFGESLFSRRVSLKFIFVTSWYFPDMMGLIAAARLYGITTVDIQHGKQGKYQPMYSGWDIPQEGYELMPDIFWCWGKKSSDHILSSSPNRANHRPIVGGYPWLQYYSRFLKTKQPLSNSKYHINVLFTLQPCTKENPHPIPDFVVKYLSSPTANAFFVFRIHPNNNSAEYCEDRLSSCINSMYSIDEGRSSLYDRMLSSTHHITAFSSCCYEASEFGIPTLLYGPTSSLLYSDEISDDIFSWTSGDPDFLARWLSHSRPSVKSTGYINSSMAFASETLSSILVK